MYNFGDFNYILKKGTPVGISKFDWYTMLSKSIISLTPEACEYIIIGIDVLPIIQRNPDLTIEKEYNNIPAEKYFYGKINNIKIYVDPNIDKNIILPEIGTNQGCTCGLVI